PKADILLGDCNMVEAGLIDRLPAHDDPNDACEALDDLKMMLNVRDGWRMTYPDKKSFTYMQTATGVQSRIDRIYMTDTLMETARDWRIEDSGIPNADHRMISVQITSEGAPWIGKGRWRIPDYVIKDKNILKYVHAQGIEAEQQLQALTERSTNINAQIIWQSFKAKITNKAKQRAQQIVPGLTRKINEQQLELDRVINDQELSEEVKMMKTRDIQIEITNLEKSRTHKLKRDNLACHRIERELPSRYMSQVSKEKKP
ncbi:hypothetical protein DFJ43DRAFT_990645, partial [Lentinula guzmanii]